MYMKHAKGKQAPLEPVASNGFARGLTVGCLLGLGVVAGALYLLTMSGVIAVSVMQVPGVQQSLNWAYRNFGLSLLPFTLVLCLFLAGLRRLQRMLETDCEPEQVAHADQMLDIWVAMFFGIGVLWTAIGMRNALIFALADPSEAARAGAFAILQRLVEGGILVALSTTIFGGVGGYLLRVLKALSLGSTLKSFYARAARTQGEAIHQSLLRIERRLGPRSTGGTASRHEDDVQPPLEHRA